MITLPTPINAGVNNNVSVLVLGHAKRISTNQLMYLEAEGNYTYLYTSDNKRYLVSKTLKSYDLLLDASVFVRIHKSTIINLNFVENINTRSGMAITLKGGHEKAISRRRVRQISNLLKASLKQHHAN